MRLLSRRRNEPGRPPEPTRVVLGELELAETRESRNRGLLGHAPLRPGQGLMIRPCRWIHMFGMAFPIDVIYVSRSGRIVAVTENLKPNRIDRPVFSARYVVELPAGEIKRTGLSVGDTVEVEP